MKNKILLCCLLNILFFSDCCARRIEVSRSASVSSRKKKEGVPLFLTRRVTAVAAAIQQYQQVPPTCLVMLGFIFPRFTIALRSLFLLLAVCRSMPPNRLLSVTLDVKTLGLGPGPVCIHCTAAVSRNHDI